MALFTDAEARDIREYVFGLKDDAMRTKILQCVSILEDEGQDNDTIISIMYYLAKNEKEVDSVFSQLMNASAIYGEGLDEGVKIIKDEG